jgi:hypothetical protein
VADLRRAGGDALEGAPAGGEQGEPAFSDGAGCAGAARGVGVQHNYTRKRMTTVNRAAVSARKSRESEEIALGDLSAYPVVCTPTL